MTTYLITDDQGQPSGMLDLDAITTAGSKLAFALAASSADHDHLLQISTQTLAEQGPAAFGYICANALQVVVEEILEPCLQVAEAHGTKLRPGIRAIADGRDPGVVNR